MTSVVVVSLLPAVRAGLRALLSGDDRLLVVGEATTLGVALEQDPDVVVLDGDRALDLETDLGEPGPGPGLVILGPLAGDDRLPGELRGRAWGYLPRDASAEQLSAAVQAVANGVMAIDPLLAATLFERAGLALGSGADADDELTAREREVLQLIAIGLPNKTIARRLGISEHTAKFHVAAILAKLGAASRTEAVHLAARRGLVAL